MDLFTITCVTCQTRLKVRDPAAIGRIVACPKCGSMVQVRAPAGWQPTSARIAPTSQAPPRSTALGPQPDARPPAAAPSRLPRARRITEEEMALLLRDTQPISDAGIDLEAIGADDLKVAPPPAEPDKMATPAAAVGQPPTDGVLRPAWVRWTLWGGLTTVVAAAVMAVCLLVAWPDAPPLDEADALALAGTTDGTRAVDGGAPPTTPEDAGATSAREPRPLPDVPLHNLPALGDPVAILDEYLRGVAEDSTAAARAEDLLADAEAAVDDVSSGAAAAADAGQSADGEALTAASPPVDVPARLADSLPRLVVRDMRLVDYYRTLSRLSTLPISLDLEALAHSGVSPRQPVTLELQNATIAEALAAPIERHGLGVVATEKAVRIAAASEADGAAIARLAVGDLAVGGTAEDLRQMVLRFVAPRTWSEAGGPGTLGVEGTDLVVEHAAAQRSAVEEFVGRLRFARGGRAVGGSGPSPLATRRQLARASLEAPLTASFQRPTRLAQIVEHLEAKTGLTICVDWAGLAEEGIGSHAVAKLHATETPAWDAIAALVEPLGLEARIVDAETLEIVGRRRAEVVAAVEFYPVQPLAADAVAAAALIERLTTEVAPDTWTKAGGWGEIAYDAPSACLIVRQSSAVQVGLVRFLETLPAVNE